ncbi:MAG: hypothetical protein KA436_06715 [Oligoflexales bacterium]|nr:hypothetical protein [Oligoflexales bacterium]
MVLAIFLLTLFSSCANIRDQASAKAKTKNPLETSEVKLEKIDPYALEVELSIRTYEEGQKQGALFMADLDPRANSLDYRACQTLPPGLCTTGSVIGLLPEPILNLPEGKLKVEYRACVVPERSLDKESHCSHWKSIYFTQKKNLTVSPSKKT